MIATVTLNPSIDETFEVRGLGAADVTRALRVRKTTAGKGVNVSKALMRLGAKTEAYVLLGGVMGREFARLAALEGLRLRSRRVRQDTRVNVTIDDIDSDREVRVLAPGPSVLRSDLRGLWDLFYKRRGRPFALVLSGSLPPGVGPGTYAEWVRRSRLLGLRCLVDADGDALRMAVKARPWAVKPNHFELENLLRRRFRTDRQVLRAALALVDGGVGIAAVSLERRGVLVVSRDEKPFLVRPPAVKVKSRVGAGDAFVAGLVLGLELRKPVHEAARLGVGVSSAHVARVASGFRAEAFRLAARSRVEWIRA